MRTLRHAGVALFCSTHKQIYMHRSKHKHIIHIHTYTCLRADTPCKHENMQTCMHANMHTCKHAYISAYRSGSLLRYAQADIHAHIHSYTRMHTHTHLYTRACMHTTYRSGSLLRCSLCPVPRRCKYHCVYMYICAYTCVLVCVCARTSMCAFTSSRAL